VVVACELVDSTGTPVFQELEAAPDAAEWAQTLSMQAPSDYLAATTLPLQAQLKTTGLTTLALVCAPIVGEKEATIDALTARISALQTTAND
jgi:hypothetical protein